MIGKGVLLGKLLLQLSQPCRKALGLSHGLSLVSLIRALCIIYVYTYTHNMMLAWL